MDSFVTHLLYLSWQLLIDPQHFPAEHSMNRIILRTIVEGVLVCFSMFSMFGMFKNAQGSFHKTLQCHILSLT